MATVKFTRHLVRFFPTLTDNIPISGNTVADILIALDEQFPGLANYIINEQGQLRRHVNIFVDGDLIHDRETLSDTVADDHVVYIFQALSGG